MHTIQVIKNTSELKDIIILLLMQQNNTRTLALKLGNQGAWTQ